MIDLQTAYKEATTNISNWRMRYSTNEYPHKIVLNMMYRAYSMNYLWEDYETGSLPTFSNFQEAVIAMENMYSQNASFKVHSNLLSWLENYPSRKIGNLIFSNYDKKAYIAENDGKMKEEVEFSYIFDLLQEKCVLYWIALRQCGYSAIDAISTLSGVVIEEPPVITYEFMKYVFQELVVKQYLSKVY